MSSIISHLAVDNLVDRHQFKFCAVVAIFSLSHNNTFRRQNVTSRFLKFKCKIWCRVYANRAEIKFLLIRYKTISCSESKAKRGQYWAELGQSKAAKFDHTNSVIISETKRLEQNNLLTFPHILPETKLSLSDSVPLLRFDHIFIHLWQNNICNCERIFLGLS